MDRLTASRQRIGELYPILKDSSGTILDGKHRSKVNPKWKAVSHPWVRTERDQVLVRIHANHHRRRIDFEERWDDFIALAEVLLKKITRNHLVTEIAELSGYDESWVRQFLPLKYKAKTAHKNKRESLSLIQNQVFGDFTAPIPSESVDLILTDPLYDRSHLSTSKDLGVFAKGVLKRCMVSTPHLG